MFKSPRRKSANINRSTFSARHSQKGVGDCGKALQNQGLPREKAGGGGGGGAMSFRPPPPRDPPKILGPAFGQFQILAGKLGTQQFSAVYGRSCNKTFCHPRGGDYNRS